MTRAEEIAAQTLGHVQRGNAHYIEDGNWFVGKDCSRCKKLAAALEKFAAEEISSRLDVRAQASAIARDLATNFRLYHQCAVDELLRQIAELRAELEIRRGSRL